jgi:hypothetical protein
MIEVQPLTFNRRFNNIMVTRALHANYRLADSIPPSTSIVFPVVKSLVTQNMIACAHSSAVPYRPMFATRHGGRSQKWLLHPWTYLPDTMSGLTHRARD